VDERGRPVIAVLPGAEPSTDDSVHIVDLRGVSTPAWLASLLRQAPTAALCATPAQRLLSRLLGIPRG
jgi:hypothetical protein